MYQLKDEKGRQMKYNPYPKFNAQKVKNTIENGTLVFNYTKDNILTQTFKKVRKAGKIQPKVDSDGNKKILKQKGENIIY